MDEPRTAAMRSTSPARPWEGVSWVGLVGSRTIQAVFGLGVPDFEPSVEAAKLVIGHGHGLAAGELQLG